SGTRHNVFGIQTGVAISFMVKRARATKDKRPARVYYLRRPELETAEEKLAFLASHLMRSLSFDEIQPDKTGHWLNLANNDFDSFIPLASKETKAARTAAKERAIFKLYTLGTSTNRDEWVYAESKDAVLAKVHWLMARYETNLREPSGFDDSIKWSETLKRNLRAGKSEPIAEQALRLTGYRPFTNRWLYASSLLVDRPGNMALIPLHEPSICLSHGKDFRVLGTGCPFDLHFLGDTVGFPFHRLADNTHYVDNITDWALKQFTAHYKGAEPSPPPSPSGRGCKTGARKIDKQAIFYYCYAVLHDPVYREKYAQNLKREFPRIPFYADFWRWADWGEQLMQLHIGYEAAQPFALTRHDEPDLKACAAGMPPKPLLKSDPAAGSIQLDSETTLRGVPPEAWAYKLGNRSAIDWVLDQHKEKKPKDPTIRERFDTYRFAEHKEKVVDLLHRVITVSVETIQIVQAMAAATR
ncbi:MAG TPA: DNA methyltransferase, partial [Alicycliphilus sp.]|nr:DNA methyltransferase [Alicycliphilus sp.]